MELAKVTNSTSTHLDRNPHQNHKSSYKKWTTIQRLKKIKIKKKALNKDVVKNWEAAEQLRNPKDVFKQFDLDNDGGLAPDEVRGALNYLGCEMSEKKFTKFFAKCDKNKDGTLSFKEFKKTL
jgi:hypothetical protein